MIRVENLVKDYGDYRAVNGLSFELVQGEILGFLGPNGAGKTTTMRILTCYFPPTSGAATVAGYDVTREPEEVRRVIGYMPEGVPLYKEMTVSEYLDFIAHSKGHGRADRRRFVEAAMEETSLTHVRHRVLEHLSKGYRQRVGLAQAILGDPKVLILDEPTAGLDPRQISEVRTLIRGMAGRRTVILSTHILPEVQMTCSRVVIINRGQIAASGTPEKLTTRISNRVQCVARIAAAPEASEDVPAGLSRLPGVLKVEVLPGSGQATAEPLRGIAGVAREYLVSAGLESPDVRPAIAKECGARGWALIELRQSGVTLEDVFMRAIAGDTGADAQGGGATARV